MVGLSKSDCISMILVQSMFFVIPSIVFGYAGSLPALHYLYHYIFKN